MLLLAVLVVIKNHNYVAICYKEILNLNNLPDKRFGCSEP